MQSNRNTAMHFIELTSSNSKRKIALNTAHILRYFTNSGGHNVVVTGNGEDDYILVEEGPVRISALIKKAGGAVAK